MDPLSCRILTTTAKRDYCPTTVAEAVNLLMSMNKRLMNHHHQQRCEQVMIFTRKNTRYAQAINQIKVYIQARVNQTDNMVTLHANQ